MKRHNMRQIQRTAATYRTANPVTSSSLVEFHRPPTPVESTMHVGVVEAMNARTFGPRIKERRCMSQNPTNAQQAADTRDRMHDLLDCTLQMQVTES